MADDPFHPQRFVDAQAGGVYEQALGEIRSGEKSSHWMWFIFPQHRDLGRSKMAKFYGLSGEARAYLAHPLLGPRYRECVAGVRTQVDARLSGAPCRSQAPTRKFRWGSACERHGDRIEPYRGRGLRSRTSVPAGAGS